MLLVTLGHRAVFKAEGGDLDASLADYQEVLALARALGDDYTLAVTLVNLGIDQVVAGEFTAALAYLQDGLEVANAHGYQHLSVRRRTEPRVRPSDERRCRQRAPPARRRS